MSANSSVTVNAFALPRERSNNAKRLEAKLRGLTGKAIADYAMIEAGDRVMVCLSGSKDSYTLLHLLLSLQRKAPIPFEIAAVNMDQKQPGFPEHVLPIPENLGVEYHVIEQDTYSVVTSIVPEGKTYCGLCSRLRRGTLYTFAAKHGFTKIALGHYRDDIVETFFMNMFHGGNFKAMPPKLHSDDGAHVAIRPWPIAQNAISSDSRTNRRFHNPLQPVRLTVQPAARANEGDVGGMGACNPGRIEGIFRALKHTVPIASRRHGTVRLQISLESIGPAQESLVMSVPNEIHALVMNLPPHSVLLVKASSVRGLERATVRERLQAQRPKISTKRWFTRRCPSRQLRKPRRQISHGQQTF